MTDLRLNDARVKLKRTDEGVLTPLLSIISVLLLSACGTIHTSNPAIDAIYNGTSAIIESTNAPSGCRERHPDEQVSCEERRQILFDEIQRSLEEEKRKKARQ